MARGRKETIEAVIAALNALEVGELSAIENKLAIARREIDALDAAELVGVLDDARRALGQGDVSNFRRLVAQAVARLGHLK